MDLVKGKQSVVSYQANPGWPFASALDYVDPEPYAMFLQFNPAFTADQIVQQVQAEFDRLQKEPLAAAELERLKTLMRANRIRELQSTLNRARALAQYEILDGNPELINTELDRMTAVTAEQVQAAAKKYFTPDKRVVLAIAPAPGVKKEGE
jgi:predicted Zn-dependent peptidase